MSSNRKLLTVNIVSQEGSVYNKSAEMVILRSIEGEMGISPGHTQLLCILPPGAVRVEVKKNKRNTFYISGGILEIQPYRVTVLSDSMERAENLDQAFAEKLRERAKASLKQFHGNNFDKVKLEKAQQILAESEARLKALKILKNTTKAY